MKPQPYLSRSNPPCFKDTEVGDIFICPDLLPTSKERGWVIVECEGQGTYHSMGVQQFVEKHCPYGVPGDRLWVRESWSKWENGSRQIVYAADRETREVIFDGQKPIGVLDERFNVLTEKALVRFKPSIHMPRWASRITLEITEVRVQRVQEIDYLDAYAEGIPEQGGNSSDGAWRVVSKFHELWDSINADRGHGWEKNDWVWALTFKRIL